MAKDPEGLPDAFERVPLADSPFDISRREKKRAERIHAARPEEERLMDEQTLEPLTEDFDEWRNNKNELDFPGVDTPGDIDDLF